MDPEYWGDPETFRPARFLVKDRDSFRLEKKEQFIPFGFGKRACMGENMAKAELFLFVTGILQRLNVKKSKNHPVPSEKNVYYGFTLAPEPFYVQFESRE